MDKIVSAPRWYVVHTKPQKELMASSLLEERLSLQVFLPEVLQKYRSVMQPRPLFPRYFFVEADLDVVEATAINSTHGVIRMVSFDNVPLPLEHQIVEKLKDEVERLNAEGGLPPSMFRPGEMVRLTQGPLKGLHAIFVEYLKPADRALVLLKFLGQENEIVLDLDELERASTLRRHRRRERTTRGKGRYIKGKRKDQKTNPKSELRS